jgi:hypothetical protein
VPILAIELDLCWCGREANTTNREAASWHAAVQCKRHIGPAAHFLADVANCFHPSPGRGDARGLTMRYGVHRLAPRVHERVHGHLHVDVDPTSAAGNRE